jgi:ABC-type multidrug transport system fused ATPase/permease subunit
MGSINQNSPVAQSHKDHRHFMGVALIVIGIAILADLYFKTGWLVLLMLPVVGIVLLISGINLRKLSLVVSGCLIGSLGAGFFFLFNQSLNLSIIERVGAFLLVFAIGWGLIALISRFIILRTAWWALLTGVAVAAVGVTFLSTPFRIVLLVLYVSAGVGLVFLWWGIVSRLFGLIIPGCLLLGSGSGVYLAWGDAIEVNGLAKTGVMLVCIAFAWALITVFSRVLTDKFVWWPLIPGGIIAMVGWGLYIGGNPNNAVNFIGNTGSIGLIIFGLYLLLLRRGIRR